MMLNYNDKLAKLILLGADTFGDLDSQDILCAVRHELLMAAMDNCTAANYGDRKMGESFCKAAEKIQEALDLLYSEPNSFLPMNEPMNEPDSFLQRLVKTALSC